MVCAVLWGSVLQRTWTTAHTCLLGTGALPQGGGVSVASEEKGVQRKPSGRRSSQLHTEHVLLKAPRSPAAAPAPTAPPAFAGAGRQEAVGSGKAQPTRPSVSDSCPAPSPGPPASPLRAPLCPSLSISAQPPSVLLSCPLLRLSRPSSLSTPPLCLLFFSPTLMAPLPRGICLLFLFLPTCVGGTCPLTFTSPCSPWSWREGCPAPGARTGVADLRSRGGDSSERPTELNGQAAPDS